MILDVHINASVVIQQYNMHYSKSESFCILSTFTIGI